MASGRRRRAIRQDRRRLHALGHDPQQGPAVCHLPDDRGQSEPAVSRGGRCRSICRSPTCGAAATQRDRAASRTCGAASTTATGCRSLPASARFRRSAPHRSRCESAAAKQRFTADAFVIATGSRPYRPPDVDFTHPRIFDSDTILDLSDTRRSRSRSTAPAWSAANTRRCFATWSARSTWSTPAAKLLEFLDDEIIDALSYHMRDRGVLIRHSETVRARRRARRRRGAASEERQAAQDRHPAVGQRPHRQLRRPGPGSRSASSPTRAARSRSTRTTRPPCRTFTRSAT